MDSDEDFDPVPLCSFNPGMDWSNNSSDWVLRKVEELSSFLRISYAGYEEQFRALITTIEAGHPAMARSAAKKERELKRLECSINYNSKGGSAFRDKGNVRAVKGNQ